MIIVIVRLTGGPGCPSRPVGPGGPSSPCEKRQKAFHYCFADSKFAIIETKFAIMKDNGREISNDLVTQWSANNSNKHLLILF